MVASSYGHGTTSSGVIKLKKDLGIDPSGEHIVIVEDLIDTGNTLAWIKNYLLSKNPKSVRICCILDKKCRRTSDIEIDYVGFDCPDEFVIGYGMDFAENYRTLPFVGVLKPECYAPEASSSEAPSASHRTATPLVASQPRNPATSLSSRSTQRPSSRPDCPALPSA